MLLGVVVLALTAVSILSLSAVIHGLINRGIGSSESNEILYRTHQTGMDALIEVISLIPPIILTYLLSVYLISPIIEMLTDYGCPLTMIGYTILMSVFLILWNWKLRQVRHTMLEEGVFAGGRVGE